MGDVVVVTEILVIERRRPPPGRYGSPYVCVYVCMCSSRWERERERGSQTGCVRELSAARKGTNVLVLI